MFAGILQRERMEREKEEAAADLAARKQRRILHRCGNQENVSIGINQLDLWMW